MDAPPASRQVLEAVARGGPPPQGTSESDQAAAGARSWTTKILRQPYWPADTVPFVAFPREMGRCDAVRAAYRAGGEPLEIAQTFSLFSVRLTNAPGAAGESPQARAERYAGLLLNTGKPVQFETLGREGDLTYGRQTRAAAPPDGPPEEPDWTEVLRWWSRGNDVGFLTLKRSRMPQRAETGVGAETNRVWFDYYRRR